MTNVLQFNFTNGYKLHDNLKFSCVLLQCGYHNFWHGWHEQMKIIWDRVALHIADLDHAQQKQLTAANFHSELPQSKPMGLQPFVTINKTKWNWTKEERYCSLLMYFFYISVTVNITNISMFLCHLTMACIIYIIFIVLPFQFVHFKEILLSQMSPPIGS